MKTTSQPKESVATEGPVKKNEGNGDSPAPSAPKNQSFCYKLKENIDNVFDRYPRLVALVLNQLLFMVLLAVSFFMGYIISRTERPSEIEQNNSFMRRAFLTKQLPIEETIANLVTLPAACMVHLRDTLDEVEDEQEHNNDNNETLISLWNNTNATVATDINEILDIGSYIDQAAFGLNYLRMDALILTNTNTTWEEFYSFANVSFEESRDVNNRTSSSVFTSDKIDSKEYFDLLYEDDPDVQSWEQNILGYAKACRSIAKELVMSLIDFAIEANSVEEEAKGENKGLSFNWIRCWNQSLYGQHQLSVGRGDPRRNASLLTSQSIFYDEQWNRNRTDWYNFFVAEQGCDEIPDDEEINYNGMVDEIYSPSDKRQCYWNAMMMSVSNATGEDGCMVNSASASWFWFTIMTTVGYGNAPPSTFTSRLLVYCFGWLMIVAFGGIMIVNANTLTALIDDVFRRTNLSRLKKPICSAPLWGIASFSYIMLIAWYARRYWDLFIPNYVYTTADSYWFSYITLLTVGLGDFYIQPQGLFTSDVIIWTTLLLHGFGILASFLDRFTTLIISWFPKRKEPFEYHLCRTDILGTGINTPYSKSLDILRELVEERSEKYDRDGDGNILDAKHRSSFNGRDDWALTPDGNTINLHRINILTEKKTLLIKLLLENQSELEERMASSAVHASSSCNGRAKRNNSSLFATTASIFFSRDGSSVSLPMPTAEALEQDEEVLHSILFRTQELRRHLADASDRDAEQGNP